MITPMTYTWRLQPGAGVKYLQAWAADAAGNTSLFPYQAFITYVPATEHVALRLEQVYHNSCPIGKTGPA